MLICKRIYAQHTLIFGWLMLLLLCAPSSLQASQRTSMNSLSIEWQAAPLRLPRFFASGMVLQRERDIPVWGWGKAGETVSVTLHKARRQTVVSPEGTWRVVLPKQKAGGPYEMTVQGSTQTLRFSDILIGDVILCSGQSNMELPIRRCMDKVADKIKGYENRQVRYLKLPHQFNYIEPQEDVRTLGWVSLDEKSTPEIGAFCYFLARELQEAKGIPIGIINSSVGGTKVDAWTRREVLEDLGYSKVLQHDKFHNTNWVNETRQREAKAQSDWRKALYQQDRWTVSQLQEEGAWKAEAQDVFQSRWQRGNGSYWLRQSIEVPAAWKGQKALLRLGAMKDADSVFVNGTCVGTTSYEYPPRNYTVPQGTLREGRNDILVHLFSYNGRPNFTSGKSYQLEVGGEVLPISAQWQILQGSALPPQPGSTYFVDAPTGLYNAMIAPLKDLPFAAIAWYQGESDCGSPHRYAEKLARMVADWRHQQQYETPFLCVQLAGYQQRHDHAVESGQASLRNQQRLAVQNIPYSALCTALDAGEWNDIHPQSKDVVGQRASWQLRKLLYKDKMVSEGPAPIQLSRTSDGKVWLRFSRKTGALDRSRPLGRVFDLYCDNGQWIRTTGHYLDAYSLEVEVPEGHRLHERLSVRYAWDDFPTCTLYNIEGIPSPSFEL